jgi:hypothetical protein
MQDVTSIFGLLLPRGTGPKDLRWVATMFLEGRGAGG